MANCIKRGAPYGQKEWTTETAEHLNLQSTLKKEADQGSLNENQITHYNKKVRRTFNSPRVFVQQSQC